MGFNVGQDEITDKCLCNASVGKVLSYFISVVDYYKGDMCLAFIMPTKGGIF